MQGLPEELAGFLSDAERQAESAKGPPAPAIRRFDCPHCGGQIDLRAAGHTLTAVCAHCASVIDASDARFKIVQKANDKVRKTFLEIGQRGKLKGVTWEVIGYVQKSDKTGQYKWDEYLLFNPYQGFRFLVHMDGHWNFVQVIKEDIPKHGFNTTIWQGDNKFQPFLADRPVVRYVKGEFYWRVKKGDTAHTEDYVCPPYLLSFEYADEDITVAMAEYTEPDVIEAAFAPKYSMPKRRGVGANQPSPYRLGAYMKAAALFLVLAALVHAANLSFSAREMVSRANRTLVPAERGMDFVANPFRIPVQSNVELYAHAPVSNSWVEIEVSLVNEKTRESYDMRVPVEYYFGHDSDGAWSEGGTANTEYFSMVPPGDYRLVYSVDAEYLRRGIGQNVQLTAKRDVPSWGNYWWTVALILFWPLCVWMRVGAFENKRWENSDFPRLGSDE